jgi:hypothetical protein
MSVMTAAGAAGLRRRWRRFVPVFGLLRLAGLVQALASAAIAGAALVDVHVSPQGIGPLVLGVPLIEASRRTVALDPAAAMIGPGCDERDQFTVLLQVAGQAMTVMAMADTHGRIEEILATPAGNAGVTLADADACRTFGADFAVRLASTLGAVRARSVQQKPVSTEFTFVLAAGADAWSGARVVSRWFAGGRTCDLLLRFGGRRTAP